ncbi:MAG: exodeoxyribonuclease III [Zetaproteobacteria bacterium CG2_30_46_52]|nr:MAG: exodeoxyribonuclease III [Zetaproteobacteria bacterium CG2_30_46_52]
MKIVSWNVNSLNVRLEHVLAYLAAEQPDVLALQETKMTDDKFPQAEIEAAGYFVEFSGQKTYNGVAIISKMPMQDVHRDISDLDDPQKRVIAATINGVRIIDVYIPNGQEVGSDKYSYKMKWLSALKKFVLAELEKHPKLVLLGDYNIAPANIDIHDPSRWEGQIMCSDQERAHYQDLLDFGLRDSLRELHPNEPMHSWWDYRANAYRRKWGIRIDHLLVSQAVEVTEGGIHAEERGKERPSDHAPAWINIA